jgi:glutamine amidotransferase
VVSVLENLGHEVELTCKPSDINNLSHLIVPGVGSFAAVVDEVRSNQGLVDSISVFARSGKPILGICLGMQLLGIGSAESEGKIGLELLDTFAESMSDYTNSLPVPHVGWNQVSFVNTDRLFEGILPGTDFYFSHSFQITRSKYELSQTEYAGHFVSSIRKENIYGVQFHPERSQAAGHQLLNNFLGI